MNIIKSYLTCQCCRSNPKPENGFNIRSSSDQFTEQIQIDATTNTNKNTNIETYINEFCTAKKLPYLLTKNHLADLSLTDQKQFFLGFYGTEYSHFSSASGRIDKLCIASNYYSFKLEKIKKENNLNNVKDFFSHLDQLILVNHKNVTKFSGLYLPGDSSEEKANESFTVYQSSIMTLDHTRSINLQLALNDFENNKYKLSDLLNFCYQVTLGVEYLHSRRNMIVTLLSVRTCLLVPKGETSGRNLVKISCLGLENLADSNSGRHLDIDYGKNTEKQEESNFLEHFRLPPWQALESLKSCKFNYKSNIWSLGILFWEILSRGQFFPYLQTYYNDSNPLEIIKAYNNNDVEKIKENNGRIIQQISKLLTSKIRLQRPICIPRELFLKIVTLWHVEPRSRPTLETIKKWFDIQMNPPQIDVVVPKQDCALTKQHTAVIYNIDPKNEPKFFELKINGPKNSSAQEKLQNLPTFSQDFENLLDVQPQTMLICCLHKVPCKEEGNTDFDSTRKINFNFENTKSSRIDLVSDQINLSKNQLSSHLTYLEREFLPFELLKIKMVENENPFSQSQKKQENPANSAEFSSVFPSSEKSQKSKRFRSKKDIGQTNAAFNLDESLLPPQIDSVVSIYSSDFTQTDFDSQSENLSDTSDTSSIDHSIEYNSKKIQNMQVQAKIEADNSILSQTKNSIRDPEIKMQVEQIENQLKTLSDDISTYTSSGVTTNRTITKTNFDFQFVKEEEEDGQENSQIYDSPDHSINQNNLPIPAAHKRKSLTEGPRQRMQKLSAVESLENRPGTPLGFHENFIEGVDMGLL